MTGCSRFDLRQYRALVRVTRWEMFRSGVDSSSGIRGHPFFQISFSLGSMGLLFSSNAWFLHASGFVHLLCAATTLLTALAIIPEGIGARERRREVLVTKPVSLRTANAARVTHLASLALFLAFCFAAVPLLVFKVRLDGTWLQLFGLVLALAGSTFAAATLWHAFSMVLTRRFGVERLRSASQLAMALAALFIVGPSLARIWGYTSTLHLPQPLTIWLPSSWFASLVVGPWHPLGAVGALLCVVAAVYVFVRLDVDAVYARAAEAEGGSVAHVALWFLDRLRRLPGPCLPAPTYAVAALILRACVREDMFRIRGVLHRMLIVIGFFGLLFTEGSLAGVVLLAAFGFFATVDGLFAVCESSDSVASWALWAAPLPATRILAATRWAMLLRSFALPAVLLTVLLARCFDTAVALLPALIFPVLADTLVCLLLLIKPRLPLANEATAPGLSVMIAAQLIVLPVTIFFWIIVALSGFGIIGAVLASVVLAGLVVVNIVTSNLTSRRLRQLECLT